MILFQKDHIRICRQAKDLLRVCYSLDLTFFKKVEDTIGELLVIEKILKLKNLEKIVYNNFSGVDLNVYLKSKKSPITVEVKTMIDKNKAKKKMFFNEINTHKEDKTVFVCFKTMESVLSGKPKFFVFNKNIKKIYNNYCKSNHPIKEIWIESRGGSNIIIKNGKIFPSKKFRLKSKNDWIKKVTK